MTLVGSPGLGFPVATAASSNVSIGDGSIDVYSVAGWASSGSLIIDDPELVQRYAGQLSARSEEAL